MGIVSVCLDCPHYQTGGYCRKKQKTVSALAPACEDSQKINEDQEDDGLKTCRKCGRVLPKENFAKNAGAPDGLQSTCRECAAAAFKAWQDKQKEKKNPMKEEQEMETPAQTKRCTKCGKELPIEDFYLKRGKPDCKCKECAKKYNVALAKKNRDAKMAQMNAGAATKVCKTCGRELPLDAFGAHAKTWDRKATVCLECMRAKRTKIKPKKAAPASAPAPQPSLADINTAGSLENFDSRLLVAELRARGYHVTCEREVKTIESL